MPIITANELLKAGAHFGHRVSRWNPKMEPYIYGKRNKIHIINLRETIRGLVEAAAFLRKVVREGRQVLVVGTKRQAAAVVEREASRAGMPYVSQRWLGGTLTNLGTIRSRIKYLEELESAEKTGLTEDYSRKALSYHRREKRKVMRNLSGIRNMIGMPGALLVIDPKREAIAVKEAERCGVPIVAVLDTDCDPTPITIPVPANDDAIRSVEVLLVKLAEAVIQGKGEAKTYVAAPSESEGKGRPGLVAVSFGGDEEEGARMGGGRGRGGQRRRPEGGGAGGGAGRGRGGPGGGRGGSGGGGGGGGGRGRGGPGGGRGGSDFGDRRGPPQQRERVRQRGADAPPDPAMGAPGGAISPQRGGSLPPRTERSAPPPGSGGPRPPRGPGGPGGPGGGGGRPPFRR
ncbi:MAG TPA: 30S ribosomal protein S2 [Planctomycetota bacterium]|nr:30S ribosomal protein S2 [Planctomycetota bacterium]